MSVQIQIQVASEGLIISPRPPARVGVVLDWTHNKPFLQVHVIRKCSELHVEMSVRHERSIACLLHVRVTYYGVCVCVCVCT